MLTWCKDWMAVLWGPGDAGVPVLPSSRRMRARPVTDAARVGGPLAHVGLGDGYGHRRWIWI